MTTSTAYAALHSATTTLVVTDDDDVPRVLHWGARLGDDVDAVSWGAATDHPVPQGGLDHVVPLSLLPERARGWAAYGGVSGHRADGRGWAPILRRVTSSATPTAYTWTGRDELAGLTATLTLTLDEHGVLAVDSSLTNDGTDVYTLDSFATALPLPARASEAMTLTGPLDQGDAGAAARARHDGARARGTARQDLASSRRRRWPSAHRPSASRAARCGSRTWRGAATTGCTSRRCPTRAASSRSPSCCCPARCASSRARRTPPPRCSRAGRAPVSPPRRSSSTRHVRARAGHPRTPRKVLLNTWEAVYFNHDVAELQRLADAAAAVGVERFVLDDGWFRGRDDDTSVARRLVRRRAQVPRRPRRPGRPRRGPRPRVRALGRARDGQPGQRPLPRAPGLGAGHRRARAASSAATSSCSTSAATRCRRTCSSGSTRCSPSTRSATSSGT